MICLALVILATTARAQGDSVRIDTSRFALTYFNQFTAGGLLGKRENGGHTVSASMIHGVRWKWLSMAAGLSLDSYHEWNIVPVYGSIGLDLGRSPNSGFFVQFSAGPSIVRHIDREFAFVVFKEEGGRMTYPSLGYRIRSEKWSMYVIAGYKFQRIRYTESPEWSPEWGPVPYKFNVVRDMERICIQLGFGLH
ncbi:MAG TPA: hypothetical protein VEB86_13410 [Chryseosolibacter sp.]|nr:hypothetical protein [Chryseosolibacter sp.]